MPRVNLNRKNDPQAKLGILLQGCIKQQRLTLEDVGHTIGASDDTARRRMRNPGDLTVSELVSLAKALHIPIDDLRAAIRY